MGFFDDLKGKATNLAQSGVAKSKQLAEIAKLKTANMGEEDTVKKAYLELGKLYYAERGHAREGAYAAACEKITAAKAAIEANNGRIAQLKADSGLDDAAEKAAGAAEKAKEKAVDVAGNLKDAAFDAVGKVRQAVSDSEQAPAAETWDAAKEVREAAGEAAEQFREAAGEAAEQFREAAAEAVEDLKDE